MRYKEFQDYLNTSLVPITKLPQNLILPKNKKYNNEISKINLVSTINSSNDEIEWLSAFLNVCYGVPYLRFHYRGDQIICKPSRPVPSGGAFYPNEIYIILFNRDCGRDELYHYEVISHKLVLIRSGDVRASIYTSLANSEGQDNSDLTIIITNVIDKNSVKYGGMSYRIQTIDSGILLQRILEASSDFDVASEYHLDFIDDTISSELHLDEKEGIMGVVTLRNTPVFNFNSLTNRHFSQVPCSNLDNHPLSEHFPLLNAVHQQTKHMSKKKSKLFDEDPPSVLFEGNAIYRLPDIEKKTLPLNKYLEDRDTTYHYFSNQQISLKDFSNLLGMAFDKSNKNYSENNGITSSLFCYCNNIEMINRGLYLYNDKSHDLVQIWEGDFTHNLFSTIVQPDFNINKSAAIFILSDASENVEKGTRSYRKANIDCGILMERLVHSSVINSLGQYPFLAYDVRDFKSEIVLPDPYLPLALVFVGHKDSSHYMLKYPMYL